MASAVLLMSLGVTGCVGLAVKGAKTAAQGVTIANNQAAADAGDARAQYEVGQAHCCAIGPVDLLHDNAKATDYLCRSAQQDYAPAQYLLGRIYDGRPIVGIDPQQSAKLMLAGSPRNLPVATMWLMRASRNGDADARSALEKLRPDLSARDGVAALAYLADWQRAPCRWQDVIVSGAS